MKNGDYRQDIGNEVSENIENVGSDMRSAVTQSQTITTDHRIMKYNNNINNHWCLFKVVAAISDVREAVP